MEQVIYEIVKVKEPKNLDLIKNIQEIDRSLSYMTLDNALYIEVEFRPCKISLINIGLMTGVKVLVKGWYKGMDNKKNIINKSEPNEKSIKIVNYNSKVFENFKDAELTNLSFSFTKLINEMYLKLNYIQLFTGNNPSSTIVAMSPRPARVYPSPSSWSDDKINKTYKAPENNSLNTKENYIIDDVIRQNFYCSEKVVGIKEPSAFQSSQVISEPQIHKNSYRGLISNLVLYSLCSSKLQHIIRDICEVIGALYLEEYSDCIDYIITDEPQDIAIEQAMIWDKPLISHRWLFDCLSSRKKLSTNDYIIK